jgi:hypothetical protein
MRKLITLILVSFTLLVSSCNSYQLVKVTKTPVVEITTAPTYTSFPTFTPFPTHTPYPTDFPLGKLRPEDTSCLTAEMYRHVISNHTKHNPVFKELPDEHNWDRGWSLDESANDGTGALYDLYIDETDGCIDGASTLVLMHDDSVNIGKRDLFLDFTRGFFSDTDGGAWYKTAIEKCAKEDEVLEDKPMNDGTTWRVFCEYNEEYNIQMYSLIIGLPK